MAYARYSNNGYKRYKVMGTNRLGECITANFSSKHRANTRKWFEDLAEHEMWRGIKFSHYVNLDGDNPYREIKEH